MFILRMGNVLICCLKYNRSIRDVPMKETSGSHSMTNGNQTSHDEIFEITSHDNLREDSLDVATETPSRGCQSVTDDNTTVILIHHQQNDLHQLVVEDLDGERTDLSNHRLNNGLIRHQENKLQQLVVEDLDNDFSNHYLNDGLAFQRNMSPLVPGYMDVFISNHSGKVGTVILVFLFDMVTFVGYNQMK